MINDVTFDNATTRQRMTASEKAAVQFKYVMNVKLSGGKFDRRIFFVAKVFACAQLCWRHLTNFISISNHRRRIELEDKAKVVGSDWGTESLPL